MQQVKTKAAELISPKIRTRLQGTRLAANLIDIAKTFGTRDADLATHVKRALEGFDRTEDGKDIFTEIRDRLMVHALPHERNPYTKSMVHPDTKAIDQTDVESYRNRANDLALGYNWHRVGGQLKVESAVAAYIDSIAKDHIQDRKYRAALKLFRPGAGEPDAAFPNQAATELGQAQARAKASGAHDAFWKGLRKFVKDTVRGSGIDPQLTRDDHLHNAMVRLATAEEQKAELASRGRGQLVDTLAPVASTRTANRLRPTDYLAHVPARPDDKNTAAYKIDKAGQYKPFKDANPEQYAKLPERTTFTPTEHAAQKTVEVDPNSHHMDGILHRVRDAKGKETDSGHLLSSAERSGLMHAVTTMGLVPEGSTAAEVAHDYLPEIRDYVHGRPRDILSRYYRQTADRLVDPIDETGGGGIHGKKYEADKLPVGVRDLSRAVSPLVRYVATQRGLIAERNPVSVEQHPSLPPEPVPEWEEVTEHNSPVAPPQDESEREEWAANLLKSLDAPKRIRAQLIPEHEFGSGAGASMEPIDLADAHHHFEIPEFTGGDDHVKDIEAHPTLLTAADLLAKADHYLATKKPKQRGFKLREGPTPKQRPSKPDQPPSEPLADPVAEAARTRTAITKAIKPPRNRKALPPLTKPTDKTTGSLPAAGDQPLNFAKRLQEALRDARSE